MTHDLVRSGLLLAAGVSLATGLTLLAAGAKDAAGKLPPPADKKGVTFARDIKSIFDAACIKCHGPEKAKGKLILNTLETVLKGSEDGKVVLPGNSAQSRLVLAVARVDEDAAMPPRGKGEPLTRDQVSLIRAWIDQGAR